VKNLEDAFPEIEILPDPLSIKIDPADPALETESPALILTASTTSAWPVDIFTSPDSSSLAWKDSPVPRVVSYTKLLLIEPPNSEC
jgi:hypothetical protein